MTWQNTRIYLSSGETGSGKSVWLRSCLTTLIKTLPEDKLHLYLADLKLSEFHLFDGVPHVRMNEWNPGAIMSQLKQIKKEMLSRGQIVQGKRRAQCTRIAGE